MGLLKDLFNIAGKVASVAQEIAAKQADASGHPGIQCRNGPGEIRRRVARLFPGYYPV